jgi:acyl-CoA thioesterase-2
LHANFLRAGRSDRELELRVARVRDGRAFATRQVTVAQGERVIMTMTASFHSDEPSPEYQAPAHSVPIPDETAAGLPGGPLGMDVVELSPATAREAPHYLAWARAHDELPDDRVLHACVMAFLSDSGAPGVAADAIGVQAAGPDRENGPGNMTTSLDHSMWFHRAGHVDDWVLVEGIALSTAGSRGLLMGSMHDGEGRRLTTFTQELLIRIGPG